MAIICSRLKITGNVSEQTPLVILKEIAEAHGIPFNQDYSEDFSYIRTLVRNIYLTPVCKFEKLPREEKPNSLLKRYLGLKEDLNHDEIEDIFNFWEDVKVSKIEDISIEAIGNPTRTFLRSFNACLLFNLCRKLKIDLLPKTTIEHMAALILLSKEKPQNSISVINQFIFHGKHSDIISFINLIPLEFLKNIIPQRSDNIDLIKNITHKDLEETLRKKRFENKNRWKNLCPVDFHEALVLGLANYNINLFYSNNPLAEYNNLSTRSYIPKDSKLKAIFNLNPNIVKFKVFDPRFPKEFYDENILKELALYEGYEREDFTDPFYELLQLSLVSETFYHGWFPNITNECSPLLELEIKDMAFNEIMCFGIMNETLLFITLEEIHGLLKSNGNFKNVLNGFKGYFSKYAIRKLVHICRTIGNPISKAIVKQIESINLLENMGSEALTYLAKYYNNSDEVERDKIKILCNKILNLGMFMRGWNGISKFPIEDAPVNNQNEVDLKVTQSLSDFNKNIESMETLKSIFDNLPIVKYENRRFITSSDPETGTTLGQRLEIMKKGENTDNINSCIRLTSNWIVASAYRYFQVLSLELPFNIETLRYIS